MPLPKSLVQPFRKNKLVVGAGWRAYFAPYNAALGSSVASTFFGPTIIDLTQGPFDSNNPPFGLADLGWIKDMKLSPGSKIGQVRSGYRGAVRAQYRGQVDESFEFSFREYGRMQYKLATGTNCINLFAASGLQGGTAGPISASGAPFARVASYLPSGPTITLVSPVDVATAQISVGSYIVMDIDYTVGTFGLVGDAGTPVFQNAVTDIDYIRKNSDYVARVTGINGAVLTLDQAFIGGGSGNPAPNLNTSTGAFTVAPKIQTIKGFTSREGGTFISEWSALFMCNTVDVAQLVVYYPHVSIMAEKDHAAPWTIENAGTTDLGGVALDAQFAALAFDDPEDGETVVSYKAYYARPLEAIGY